MDQLSRTVGALAAAGLVLLPACSVLPTEQAAPGPAPVVTPPPTVDPVDPPPDPSPSPSPTPSPTPTSFAQTYAEVSSGVVRIDVAGCEGGGSGTGFLIDDDLVATVAHVVSDAATVRVTHGTTSTSATVLGMDEETDTALVRTSGPLSGHVFDLAEEGPVVGERIGVIGFPAGDNGLLLGSAGSKSFKEGSVNGVDRKVRVDGQLRTGLMELDALARGGNSGSPVFEMDGDVVGLLSSGPMDDDATQTRQAVDSRIALPLLDEWAGADEPVPPANCSDVMGPDGEPVAFTQLPGGESAEVAATLNLYFKSINQGDYETAYAQRHPDAQSDAGFEAFAEGVRSSEDSDISYNTLTRAGRDLVVWTEFRSVQDPEYGPEGLACTDWSLDYTLRQSDGLWLILKSEPHDGVTRYTPCGEDD